MSARSWRGLGVLAAVSATMAVALSACSAIRAPVRRRPSSAAAEGRAGTGDKSSSSSGTRGAGDAGARALGGEAPVAPRVHQVQPGENAYRIAVQYGVSVESLAQANGLDDPTKLRVGQTLVIPGKPNGAGDGAGGAGSSSVGAGVKKDGGDGALAAPIDVSALRCRDFKRADAEGASSAAGKLRWPVDGVVVSRFGHVEDRPHDGIDIAAPLGTPIYAAADGRVRYAGFQDGYGELVIVEHGEKLLTVYAHNAKNCVKAGDKVAVGDVLALVGQSGGANAPVVHFEVRQGVQPVDPRRFLP
ncbi:MAG: peptidoglycan DD-metalloendopeptidase family protein [Deltaproteobacteria bacterium]|nr:peptidoglycan DD-metalloendopeptidase family protein [Deltaproteobacteria bacterium]